MPTNYWITVLLAAVFGIQSAQAQPLPIGENEEIPVLDGKNADILGSIANTNIDQVIADRLSQGILRPELGVEDVFLVKSSSTKLDLAKIGQVCIQATVGGLITSKNPAERPLNIESGAKLGTTQLIVTERVGGPETCATSAGKLVKIYRITVTEDDLFALLQQLKALIGNIEGLEIRIVGSQVVLDGQIIAPKELRRLLTVLEKHPDGKKILNLVEVSPVSMQIISEKMEEAIAGGPDRPRDIKVKVMNGRFFLEGSVDKRAQREEAIKMCQSFVTERYQLSPKGLDTPDVGLPECNNLVFVRQGAPKEPDPILSVRVDFVTLSRNYAKSFDFSWRPGISTTGGVNYDSDLGKFAANFVGTLSGLFPKLANAANHGYGRILKTATLLVRDQASAQDSGGEPKLAKISESLRIPYEATRTNANGTREPYTEYAEVKTDVGIRASSFPGSDKVALSIVASQADADQQGGGAPRILENKVDTEIIVSNGQSAALGGLVSETRSVSYNRSPSSSDFELFSLDRHHALNDKKSQFIIFITPEKMRTPAAGTEQLKRKFRLRR